MADIKYNGCLMVKLEIDKWDEIESQFALDDLIGNKFENDSHITIIYGLDSLTSPKEIQEILAGSKLIGSTLNLSKVSIFENPERDVIKYNITDAKVYSQLKMLYSKILKGIDNKQTFPNYIPHCTIAYVKKGTSQKYLKSIPAVTGKIVDFWYSTHFTL